MKRIYVKAIAWAFIAFISVCIVLQLTSCSTVKKSRRSVTTSRDSTAHTTFTGTRVTTTSELSTEPVIMNPGNLEAEFDMEDTCAQVFETEGYKVEVKPGKKKEGKPGPGNIKVTGKDMKKDVPINKTTTVTETGTREDKTQVKETTTVKASDKEKTGAPWWLVPACILVGVIVFGFGIIRMIRK